MIQTVGLSCSRSFWAVLHAVLRGRVERLEPANYRKGIWLHRQVDGFTDAHLITLLSRRRFANEHEEWQGLLLISSTIITSSRISLGVFLSGAPFAICGSCLQGATG